jgi:hypothetical protein
MTREEDRAKNRSISMRDSMWVRLERLARDEDTSVSRIIRRCVEAALGKSGRQRAA